MEAWHKLFPIGKRRFPPKNVPWNGRLVTLRSKHPEDAQKDHAWRSDPVLAALDACEPLNLSYEMYRKYQIDEIKSPSAWSVRFAIDTVDGHHIGNCMVYDVDYKKRHAEIGIMIGDKTYWDRGYGTDAILTLVNGIFGTTDLDYLYLHTLAGNIRAQQAFTNAGFCPVRSVTREGNHFIFMEALRDEWLQRHKLPEERSET